MNSIRIGNLSLHSRPEDTGFTLIEAVMSLLIVGLMLVAALNTVGASRITQMQSTEQRQGLLLADELLTEILNQSYIEPVDSPVFGRETGEYSGSRQTWDDVDDYADWSASPPESKAGVAIMGMSGWTRQVSVTWVSSLDPDVLSVSDSGIKRIKVTVSHNMRVIAELEALRGNNWPKEATGPADPDAIQALIDSVGGALDALLK